MEVDMRVRSPLDESNACLCISVYLCTLLYVMMIVLTDLSWG